MSTAKYDFTINQGSTFTLPLVWKDSEGVPLDLTGLTPKMQIRTRGHALILDCAAYFTTVPLQGKVTLTLPGSVTRDLDFDTAIYDLELIGGENPRLLRGVVMLSREVTTQ